jgi:hypothetical protein
MRKLAVTQKDEPSCAACTCQLSFADRPGALCARRLASCYKLTVTERTWRPKPCLRSFAAAAPYLTEASFSQCCGVNAKDLDPLTGAHVHLHMTCLHVTLWPFCQGRAHSLLYALFGHCCKVNARALSRVQMHVAVRGSFFRTHVQAATRSRTSDCTYTYTCTCVSVSTYTCAYTYTHVFM